MQKIGKLRLLGLSGIFLLLSFPSFYYVYKFANPEPIAHDFFQYYRLYKDFDIGNVNSPFNMRLVGAFVVYIFYNVFNLHYETATAFDVWTKVGFLKQVFFCAVFFNYICVAATSVVIYLTAIRFATHLLAILAGCAYILGFGTIFYCLMPLTEAASILLFSIFLYQYCRRNRVALFIVAMLVFQREFLLLAIALLAITDLMRSRSRYEAIILGGSAVGLIANLVLRETVFYTPALQSQIGLWESWQRLVHWDFSIGAYVRQTMLTMNIVLIYLAILVWKSWKGQQWDRHHFFQVFLLFLLVNFLSIAGGHGTNNGRYFYMLVPLVILFAVQELVPVVGPAIPPEAESRPSASG